MNKVVLYVVLSMVIAGASARAITPQKNIVILCGTARPDSQTARVAEQLHELYVRAGSAAQVCSIADLSPAVYRRQAYAEKPHDFKAFNQALLAADAIVIVFPEYNAGMPGALKHVLDLLAWPDTFKNHTYALVSVSAGEHGGARAYAQLEKNLQDLGAHVVPYKTMVNHVYQQLGTKSALRALSQTVLDAHVHAVLAEI